MKTLNLLESQWERIILSFCCLFFYTNNIVFAEGTAQLAPGPTDEATLIVNLSSYNSFGRYDGTDDQRLYFHIDDPNNEQVFLGFSQPSNSPHYPCPFSGVGLITGYFRIKDPSGAVVYPTPGDPNGQVLNGATSNITTKAQAVAGPSQIVGASGYTGFAFDPSGLAAGDYYVEFSTNSASNGASLLTLRWFDITVATTGGSPSAIDGRVFSKNWAISSVSISCGSNPTYNVFDNPFGGAVYAYSSADSIVTKVDFAGSGFQPLWFNMFFNDSGPGNTGNVCMDRQSRSGVLAGTPLYPLFLNDPDISVYPSGTLGQFAVNPIVVGCTQNTTCIIVEVTKEGQIEVVLDFDQGSGQYIYDPGTADVVLALKVEAAFGEGPPYRRCLLWDGNDGLGNPVNLVNPFDLSVKYTQGIYHFPVYDAEYMLTGISPTTERPIPPTGNPGKLYYDDSQLFQANGTGEPSVEINGCTAPCHTWSNFNFGDTTTVNTWFFAAEEIFLTNSIPDCSLIAVNDTVTTPGNTSIIVGVLGNDIGAENVDTALTTTTGVLQPMNGLTSVNAITGDITYIPNSTFAGIDSFEYVMCYDLIPIDALCDTATVYVTVQNQPPTAVDDTETVSMDIANQPIDVLDLGTPDSDPNNHSLTIIGAGTDASDGMTDQGGTVSINNNGTPGDPSDDFIDYTPPNGFTGQDTFQYEISDGNGGMDIAMVTVNVYSATEIDCTDGVDNDGDGLVDCDDVDDCKLPSTPVLRK